MATKKTSEITWLIYATLYSLVSIFIISGFGILNPVNRNWLSIGDGTGQISWEFFRDQPVIQFPLGLNPNYGLEISNTIAFDGQIPLMSLILHPISSFLSTPFQYFGFFIFFTFLLNFYASTKIFIFFKFNNFQTILGSIILSSLPITLNRTIENTHYALSSTWIILAAIYLSLTKSISALKWSLIVVLISLIHPYYFPFVILIFFFSSTLMLFNDRHLFKQIVKIYFTMVSSLIFTMWVVGYFISGVDSADVGYGLFRSSLSSLFDSSGWSQIFPDLKQTEGAYEGFGYIGTSAIVTILLYLIVLRRIQVSYFRLFMPLFISAIILFILSLSNKISILEYEIFYFNIPNYIQDVVSIFRSSGRFIWLLSILLLIFPLVQIHTYLSAKNFSIFLVFVSTITFVDYFPQLTSQRDIKFSAPFKSNLTDKAWKSIFECYENIRLYPPTVSVQNYYNFLLLASDQDLGINTGRFSRVDSQEIEQAYERMHKEFNTGKLQHNSFYVFTQADFIIPELVEFQKNLALQTLDDASGYGELNGFTFIAPKIAGCEKGDQIKSKVIRYGISESRKYMGEKIQFGIGKDTSKYVLAGFSALEEWGVWSVDNDSRIILNTANLESKTTLIIEARDLSYPQNIFTISINQKNVYDCSFDLNFSTCEIPFAFKDFDQRILNLSISPKIIRSPKDLGLNEDTRNLGLGLKSISIN
jgi:hypothetical protein